MLINGVVEDCDSGSFIIRPSHHIEIVADFVPFVANGVRIQYGGLRRLARLMGRSVEDMIRVEIGNVMSVEVRKKVVSKKGSLGETYKSVYLYAVEII